MKLDYIHSANVEVPSANAIQVSRMCEAFAQAGADVTLWYPRFASADTRRDWRAYHGVATSFDARPVPVPMTARLFASPALPALKLVGYTRMLARLRSSDVIYTRCFAASAFFPRLLRGPRVMFEAHEFPPSRSRLRALRGVDAIVSITAAAADEIGEALQFPRARMLVAPDGVPARWLAEPLDRDVARGALGLSARPLAVYTGKFQAGTAELLAAIATRLGGRADLLALGLGAAEARARVGDVAGLTIRDAVSADDARRYQAAADVLLMPHTGQVRWARYTSPLKLFEYMAAARPIVASHLPVLDEVVRHGETAWLVPVGDAAAMADGIAHILDDRALAARLAGRARDEVGHYTWEARAHRILDLARELAT